MACDLGKLKSQRPFSFSFFNIASTYIRVIKTIGSLVKLAWRLAVERLLAFACVTCCTSSIVTGSTIVGKFAVEQ